jgi:hypothetical protein
MKMGMHLTTLPVQVPKGNAACKAPAPRDLIVVILR